MGIELLEEEFVFRRVTKRFTISVNDKIIKMLIYWENEADGGYDYDYEIIDQENYDSLTDEERDDFDDFISDLQ
jgi:hypothetical protein